MSFSEWQLASYEEEMEQLKAERDRLREQVTRATAAAERYRKALEDIRDMDWYQGGPSREQDIAEQALEGESDE